MKDTERLSGIARDLANFWDTHDVTDFEDELEEVPHEVFVRGPGESGTGPTSSECTE